MMPNPPADQLKPAHRRHEMEVKDFRVACGEFIGVADVEREELEKPGRALVPEGIRYEEGIFAARLRGTSMEPKILDNAWGLFHRDVVGTRQNRLVLVEDQSQTGGERYTLKKYYSKKGPKDGGWEHTEILLLPLNPEHSPIRLEPDGNYRICGWCVGQVEEIERVELAQFRYVVDE